MAIDRTKGELTEAEIMGLAAILNVEAVCMAGANQLRAHRGESSAWDGSEGDSDAETALKTEFRKRGVLP